MNTCIGSKKKKKNRCRLKEKIIIVNLFNRAGEMIGSEDTIQSFYRS